MIFIALVENPKQESILLVADTQQEAELYAARRGTVLDLGIFAYESKRLPKGVIAANTVEYCPYYSTQKTPPTRLR
jgi:hypothetical protein